MNEKQARELEELRAFLGGRGITVEQLVEEAGAGRVRMHADQEVPSREAMAVWTRTRTALFVKRPRKPAVDEGWRRGQCD